MAQGGGVAEQGDNLVFLLSVPRSGSTLLSLMLGSHPAVLCPPEPWFLLKLSVLSDRGFTCNAFDDQLATLGAREFLADGAWREAARAFAVAAYNHHLRAAGKTLFVDKTPRYYHILPLLDALFPRARKIWLLRDPLDVALSYRDKWNALEVLTGSAPLPAALDFAHGLFALETYFREPSPFKLRVSYEALVASPEQTLAEVCRFLNVPQDPRMIDYGGNEPLLARHRAASMGDKSVLARPGVRTDRVGKWQGALTRAEVQSVVELLGLDIFERLGYRATLDALGRLAIAAVPEERAAQKRERVVTSVLSWRDLSDATLSDLLNLVRSPDGPAAGALRDGHVFASRVGTRLRRRLDRLVGPPLGTLVQHEPRPLHAPRRYRAARPPEPAPAISIVTPSFNQAGYLGRAIRSVIEQRYPRLEYIVQDGGSTDGSLEILAAQDFRLQWESRPDAGQAQALNRGFARASGEILSWLNGDDMLLPGTLNYVAGYFASHPSVDVVYGHRVIVDEEDRETGRWVMPPHDGEVLSWADYIPQETLFWRRRIWEKAGGRVDESFHFALDWDLLLRFREAGAVFARVPRFLGAFRVHAAQKTSTPLSALARRELDRIRERVHNRRVLATEVEWAAHSFLVRSTVYWRLHRWGLLRY